MQSGSAGKSGAQLAQFLLQTGRKNCVVLTGAGCSTESGIPDYRGPSGRYRQKDFVPITYQNLMKRETERQRYWARSMLGFSRMGRASCSGAHEALYELVQLGVVSHIITQNVDGLHHLVTHGGKGDTSDKGYIKYTTSASLNPLTELHGNIHRVVCVTCGDVTPRSHLQPRLMAANPELCKRFLHEQERSRPDGDFNLPLDAVEQMKLVSCSKCGGMLKPHVVLFGENIRKEVVQEVTELVKAANSLLCVGTSLQVFSAYRYVRVAKEYGVPVAVVNAGHTRADDLVDMKIDTERLSVTLKEAILHLNE